MADRASVPLSARAPMMRLATRAAVAVAALLIAAKLAAWVATGSVALLSTLVDSTLDAAASVINLLAVRSSLQPADREHRFGHGKAEPLAGLGQSAFIAGSALFVIVEAGQRLFAPEPVRRSGIGIAVMALSAALTLLLVYFQRRVVRETGSIAIRADKAHYTGDLLMNLAVIVSLALGERLGWAALDPLLAIVIALSLLWSSARIARSSMDVLMDREMPDEARARIVEISRAEPGVRNVHDLRTRSTGAVEFIQFHLELDPDITLRQAHVISDAVEARLRAAFPNSEIIVHQDPAGIDEPRADFELDPPARRAGG